VLDFFCRAQYVLANPSNPPAGEEERQKDDALNSPQRRRVALAKKASMQ